MLRALAALSAALVTAALTAFLVFVSVFVLLLAPCDSRFCATPGWASALIAAVRRPPQWPPVGSDGDSWGFAAYAAVASALALTHRGSFRNTDGARQAQARACSREGSRDVSWAHQVGRCATRALYFAQPPITA